MMIHQVVQLHKTIRMDMCQEFQCITNFRYNSPCVFFSIIMHKSDEVHYSAKDQIICVIIDMNDNKVAQSIFNTTKK